MKTLVCDGRQDAVQDSDGYRRPAEIESMKHALRFRPPSSSLVLSASVWSGSAVFPIVEAQRAEDVPQFVVDRCMAEAAAEQVGRRARQRNRDGCARSHLDHSPGRCREKREARAGAAGHRVRRCLGTSPRRGEGRELASIGRSRCTASAIDARETAFGLVAMARRTHISCYLLETGKRSKGR